MSFQLGLLAILITLASCKTTQSRLLKSQELQPPQDLLAHIKDVAAIEHFEGLEGRTKTLWQEYVKEVSGFDLISTCKPLHYSPPKGKPIKGLVVLYHGFTGCPIQLKNSAILLADRGYHAFLPLGPGQGRQPKKKVDSKGATFTADNLADLPKTAAAYEPHLQRILNMVKSSPVERIIGGFSGGGAIAAALLVRGAPEKIWTRGILLAPFFKIQGSQRVSASDIATFSGPLLSNSWGEECLTEDRLGARNGTCSFQVQHLRALIDLGKKAGQSFDKLSIPIQVVGIDEDGASNNDHTIAVYEKMKGQKSICFYGQEVEHAIVYSRDVMVIEGKHGLRLKTRDTTYPWAVDVHRLGVDFMTDGTAFSHQLDKSGKKILSFEATYNDDRPAIYKCFYSDFR